MKTYLVVREDSLSVLVSEVNKLLEAGFRPHGSMSVLIEGTSVFYYQPVYREINLS